MTDCIDSCTDAVKNETPCQCRVLFSPIGARTLLARYLWNTGDACRQMFQDVPKTAGLASCKPETTEEMRPRVFSVLAQKTAPFMDSLISFSLNLPLGRTGYLYCILLELRETQEGSDLVMYLATPATVNTFTSLGQLLLLLKKRHEHKKLTKPGKSRI